MSQHFEKMVSACGGVPAIAKHFRITEWAVRKWARRVPAERCHALVALSGGKLHLKDLRPDLWD